MRNTAKHILRSHLARIRSYDSRHDYGQRNKLIVAAVSVALSAGYEAGFRIDPANPAWPVAFIELPTGQISWHIPQHIQEWDNHTTEEKYTRIEAFAQYVDDNIPISDG